MIQINIRKSSVQTYLQFIQLFNETLTFFFEIIPESTCISSYEIIVRDSKNPNINEHLKNILWFMEKFNTNLACLPIKFYIAVEQ